MRVFEHLKMVVLAFQHMGLADVVPNGPTWANVNPTGLLPARAFLGEPCCFVNDVINAIEILQGKLRNMIVLYIKNEG